MARFFKLIAFLFLTSFISCQEGRDAGDLWGQWRMTGSDSEYICFSGSVSLFRSVSNANVYGNFQHVGDSIFIQCYSIDALRSDTTTVEEIFGFKPFTDIRVKIKMLNEDNLVLSKDSLTWSFYKY